MLELLSYASTAKTEVESNIELFSSIQAVIISYASSALLIEHNDRERCFVTSEHGLIVIARVELRPFAVFVFDFLLAVVVTTFVSQVYLLWMMAASDMTRRSLPICIHFIYIYIPR